MGLSSPSSHHPGRRRLTSSPPTGGSWLFALTLCSHARPPRILLQSRTIGRTRPNEQFNQRQPTLQPGGDARVVPEERRAVGLPARKKLLQDCLAQLQDEPLLRLGGSVLCTVGCHTPTSEAEPLYRGSQSALSNQHVAEANLTHRSRPNSFDSVSSRPP